MRNTNTSQNMQLVKHNASDPGSSTPSRVCRASGVAENVGTAQAAA